MNVIKFRQYLKAGQLIIVDGAKTTLIASTHVTIGVLQDYVRDFKKLKSAEIWSYCYDSKITTISTQKAEK